MAENSEAVDGNIYAVHIYHPPTKLWEGNVFSPVCLAGWLFTGGGFPCDHYPLCIGPHCTVPLPSVPFPL